MNRTATVKERSDDVQLLAGAGDAGRDGAGMSAAMNVPKLGGNVPKLGGNVRKLGGLMFFLVSFGTPLTAQWVHHKAQGIPRKQDGKPNLSARAPRMPDGKPDLS